MVVLRDERTLSSNRMSTLTPNLVLPRHRWYEFKEGFSEQLVRAAIEDSGRAMPKILDPFSGGGTTAVTAGRIGLTATAIEVNPFAAFASRAKCAPRRRGRANLERTVEKILKEAQAEVPSPLEGVSTFTDSVGLSKWLFNRSVLRGFHAVHARIRQENGLQGPLRLALFAALMDCCNAKRDGKCLRYRPRWQSSGADSVAVRTAFRGRAAIVVDDLVDDDFNGERVSVLEGDCRRVLATLPAKSFDLIVTSPPYLNSFDYSDVYRPELFTGGFVRDNADLRRIRLSTIRSHVQVAWAPVNYAPSPGVGRVFSALRDAALWSSRLPHMVRSYFADLKYVLRECLRVIRPGGAAWIVISTSAYAGIEIEVDELLADMAERVGWTVERVTLLRQLRASGQHFGRIPKSSSTPLRESLVVLRRPTA